MYKDDQKIIVLGKFTKENSARAEPQEHLCVRKVEIEKFILSY